MVSVLRRILAGRNRDSMASTSDEKADVSIEAIDNDAQESSDASVLMFDETRLAQLHYWRWCGCPRLTADCSRTGRSDNDEADTFVRRSPARGGSGHLDHL